MTMETVRVSIETYFRNGWGNLSVIFFENDKIVPPAETYVATALLKTGAQQASIGAARNRYRHYYTWQIDIYAPESAGMKSSNIIDQKIRDMFTGLVLTTTDGESINFLSAPDPRSLGFKNSRYRTLVRCPLYSDQLRARATP